LALVTKLFISLLVYFLQTLLPQISCSANFYKLSYLKLAVFANLQEITSKTTRNQMYEKSNLLNSPSR